MTATHTRSGTHSEITPAVTGEDLVDLRITVSTERLIYLLDPLHNDTWSVGAVTVDQVDQALHERRLRPGNPCWADRAATSTDHAERIAWLIHHGWDPTEPLELDVDQYGGISLNDGNHRLYALAYQHAAGPVTVEVSGYIDIASELLGVPIP